MRFDLKHLFLAACLAMAAGIGRAQTTPVNVTTTAVPFLQITPDARAAGMGDMGLATAPDAYGGIHNGAKTSFSDGTGAIGVDYTPWLRNILQDMYLLSASGYYRPDENEALTGSVRYFNLGDVAVSDYSGNKLLTAHPREYSFDLGYSRKLSSRLGIGLTARYIRSDLGSGNVGGEQYKPGTAVAADVSLYYNGLNREGQGWTAGAVLSNLGSKISYTNDATARDFLPAGLGAGVAYTGVVDEDNRWTLGVEANKLLVPATPSDSAGLAGYHTMDVMTSWGKSFSNSAYKFSAGGEYGFKGRFFLRAGYTAETKPAGDLRYFTAGAGLRYSALGLDFSYLAPSGSGVTQNPLSNTFRLGFSFRFGDRER